jgi:hypothetical protein
MSHHAPTASAPVPLTLVAHPADWRTVATALTRGGRPVLSNLVRAGLASPPRGAAPQAVGLSFDPTHAAAIRRVAAGLGVRVAAGRAA